MRTVAVAVLAIWSFGIAAGQSHPFETEAMRAPRIKTGGDVLIRGGRVLTVTKGILPRADILILDGRIAKIGPDLSAPPGVAVIDARGKVVTPGIVDAHIHRGILSTNEGTESIVGEVRIGDVLNPNAKSIWQALAAGETTGLALHGSANCIGGESQVIKLKYRRPVEDMPFKGAPRMIKFALGENVTRSGSTDSQRFPRTRMGVQQLYRRAFTEARAYMVAWDAWEKGGKTGPSPRRDLRLETLADILRKRVWVMCHSYRADEMLMMVRLSQEFGFKLAALQHALEAYKIAPELAKAGVGVSMFVDNWSFKVEGYDGIPYNAWMCQKAGVLVSINTDGTGGVPAISIDAAKPMRWGGVSETDALAMITINPARQMGIANRVGSLEVGKDGDVVIWDGHPLSVYSRCHMTLIEGEVFFQKRDAFGLDTVSTFKPTLTANKRTPPLRIARGHSYLIRGATVHPVSKPAMANADVLVSGGKIVAVGTKLSAPRDAVVVAGAGLHVYPGFVDAGSSMGLSEISPIGQMVDERELGTVQPDLVAATAIQVQSEHFPVARMGGVLAAMVRPSGGQIAGQASVVQTFGWTGEQMALGPRMLVVSTGGGGGFGGGEEDIDCCGDDLSAHEGHEWLGGQGGRGGQGGGGGQSVAELDRAFQAARDYMERRRADAKTPVNLQHEAMIPYLEGRAKVLVRCGSSSSIRRAIELADKHKLKVVLSGAGDAWKFAPQLKEKGIAVLISPAGRATLGSNAPVNDWDPYETPFALGGLLHRAGVKFAYEVGSGSDSHLLAVRVGQSCAYGLPPGAALRAITLSAAEILGVSDRLGSIDRGKIANLVITDGDPFELTTNVVAVFAAGQPRPLESRFTRLRDQWLERIR